MKRRVSKTFSIERGVMQIPTAFNFLSLILLMLVLPSLGFSMPCPGGSGVIGGNVFTDFDFNGLDDESGAGIEAVEVYLFESTGTMNASSLITSTTTDSNGDYFFTGLTDGSRYRVEFVIPSSIEYLKPSPNGSDSRTTVQYPTSPDCSVDLGLACPTDFCGEDSEVNFFTPCYIAGDPLAGGNSGTGPGIVAAAYNASGTNTNTTVLQTKDVGSIWGLAYQRTSKVLYGAATLRRHAGFGPGGTGAIYVVDASNPAMASTMDVIDLDALGFDTGTDPRIGNPLPSSRQLPSHDTDAYSLVGKMSLGDIEMSDDNKELWVINLFDKTLNKIFVNDPYQSPTAADVSSMPIPNPGCSNGEYRPWAVKYNKGKVYVGVICDASVSQDNDDLHAYIYMHDPAGTPGNFTSIFDFNLSYDRGYVYFGNQSINEWYSWTDNANLAEIGGFFQRPQPILSDIEFDDDGSLVLGFLDRMGQQGGFQNFSPDPNDFNYYDSYSGGDIIRVCNLGGTYTLEGSTGCTTAGGSGNNQGPNGSEYYFSDQFENPSVAPIHQEITLGGLAIKPGTGEVISTVFDPLTSVNTGGVTWFNNTTGERNRSYQIFEGTIGFSGKSNGLGDLELSCQAAPIEIGNYVWKDTNMDGIQDPEEAPIPGVDIALYATDGTLLDVSTTDANGEYYFSSASTVGLTFNTDYYLVVGYNQFNTSTQTLFDTLAITVDSTGMNVEPNLNDSDAEIGMGTVPSYLFGFPYTPITTGGPGCNDHSFDFGFFCSNNVCALSLDAVAVQPESCLGAGNGEITITTSPATGVQYSIDGGATFYSSNTFSGLLPGTYKVVVMETATPICMAIQTVEVLPGTEITPPSNVEGYKLCLDNLVPTGDGLKATCSITCHADSTQRTTWWTADMGGSMVGTGNVFDPVGAGLMNKSIADTVTYYVQCECGICVSDRVPAQFIVLPNIPTEIVGNDFVCPGETSVFSLANDFGNEATWTVSGGGNIVTQDDLSVTVKWTAAEGTGPYNIAVVETTVDGCETAAILPVNVKNTSLNCNDRIQISLDENGEAKVTPDQVLEGSYNNFDCFDVNIKFNNQYLGDVVDCRLVGQTVIIEITGDCDQNKCWAEALIEDKKGPIIECPTDTIEVDCSVIIDDIPPPTATDNCTVVSYNLVNSFTSSNNNCTEIIVKKVWEAVDDYGRSSRQCTQIIKVLEPELPEFPDDVTWTCEQYAAFPNIVEPTSLHPFILKNAEAIDTSLLYCSGPSGDDVPFIKPYHDIYRYWLDNEDLDVNLDPNYDDSPDNDTATDVCNLSTGLCPYMDTIVNNSGHYPVSIVKPIFRTGGQINGLEDADILELTGSGIPSYFEHGACPFSVTYRDEKGAVCTGLDTTIAFKILRTWEIRNWCNGETYTDVQIISVLDKVAPTIVMDTIELVAENPAVGHNTQKCTSTGLIPPPNAYDNCDPDLHVQIFTPLGEAIYKNGVDGSEGGYIPAPGLTFGTHEIVYQVSDACHNKTKDTVVLNIIDDKIPTMVCREFTDISITLDGTAIVCAEEFDEGSTDNCGIDSLMIKRMGEPDSLYRPCLDFSCDDVCMDSTVMIVLRAYDCSKNHNQCMIEARIHDRLSPTCIPPSDVWIDCDELPIGDVTDTLFLQDNFGNASIYDNCIGYSKELAPRIDVNLCGIGSITRLFEAKDKCGNSSRNLCRQQIRIQPRYEYMIEFPADWVGQCGDMEDAPDVTFMEMACDQIAVNYEDLRFDVSSDGACYKILRTWRVMNWCSYDGVSDPIIIPNRPNGIKISHEDYNAFGFYIYEQVIKVEDTVAPVIVYDGPTEFCSTNDNCTAMNVTIAPTDIEEECTTDLNVRWKFDLNNNGTFDAEGFNTFTRTLPLGSHSIEITVLDGCGNVGSKIIEFEVTDCKKPTPVCHNGVSGDIMHTGMLEIWATDFDAGSFDFCTQKSDLKFRMNHVTDRNGDGSISSDDYTMTPPAAASVTFTCADLGVQMIQMWVGDDYDNWDFCVAFMDVQDNMGTCSGVSKLGGNIATSKGDGVMEVKVELSGNSSTFIMTDEGGMFEFNNLLPHHDYTITPLKNTDITNGVSTFDIHLIAKHVLNVQPLSSPYYMIAADINKSGSITTLDMVELRKVVLRVSSQYRNNTSWRFVDKDYSFQNPSNPFTFPEVVNYNDLFSPQLSTDFIAIKIGDVNGDAQTDNSQKVEDRSGASQIINVENETLEAGTSQTVRFNFENAEALSGFQFTLNFDPTLLTFENIIENESININNFGLSMVEDGAITASWDGSQSEELFFDLTFRASQKVDLKEVLKITSEYTPAEAFDKEGEFKNIDLMFDGQAVQNEVFTLFQNKPNPFAKETLISFELPQNAEATMTIFDLSGKVVKVIKEDYPAGYNEILISREDLNATGIYYYRLETADGAATRKMMLLD